MAIVPENSEPSEFHDRSLFYDQAVSEVLPPNARERELEDDTRKLVPGCENSRQMRRSGQTPV